MYNNFFEGKKILLTGHTGFKGSWASIWLSMMGANVYGFSLEPKSKQDNFVTCGLKNILKHQIGDIRDAEALGSYFEEVKPDIAFHFAAQPLVLSSYHDPVETFQTNLMGVVNFFEAVRKTSSVKVAINITSDKCYANQEWVWGYRENDPMGGRDPYSASKGCAELITASYLASYFKDSSCNIASVRAGNVIGGGDWAENRIVPDFFRAIINNTELEIRSPYATRPWQHVLEPLSGYFALAEGLYEDSSLTGGWNFGPNSNNNFNVQELINQIRDYIKKGNYKIENKGFLHESMQLKLDMTKAVNILKWHPVLNFSETVIFTSNGYISELETKNNVLHERITQIKEYVIKAQQLNIPWAIK